jgi:metal-dependent amidase/aminoacylase/carboxypeptidase family protein
LTELCEHVAAAHGLTVSVDYPRGYPVTVNAPDEIDRAARLSRALLGDDAWLTMPQPLAGAEDFSYVLQEVPGAFVFVSATPAGADPRTAPYNHSAQARFSDDALVTSSALLAAFALDRLAEG